ncbi:MAG TPA: hypothetical protein VHP14_04500 [Anaerolineales bacterium]|nr:hypothetical protein [Anaerolineales bacterium]
MRSRSQNLVLFIIGGLIVMLACSMPAAGAPSSSSTSQPAAVQPTDVLPSEAPAEATQPADVPPTEAPGEAQPTAPALTVQPAMPERRRLTLEFPPRIRTGDSDLVRLTLEVDALGNLTPTAEMGGNVVTGEVIEIPNVYETHHVAVEVRFDIAGMEVSPTGAVTQPLTPGTSATFYWSIRPQDAGNYRGTIWLHLLFVNKSNGEESRKPVSAQIVEIEAVNFLGLSGSFARVTGLVGSFVGTVLGFPFLEEILKFLFKKRSKA